MFMGMLKKYNIKIIVTDKETGEEAQEVFDDIWNNMMDTPEKVLKIILSSYKEI